MLTLLGPLLEDDDISDDNFRIEPLLSNLSRYVHNDPVNSVDPSGLAEIPAGTEANKYRGKGKWTFKNKEDAYQFFEILLTKEERPKKWREKADLGCKGLNLLRVGTPSGEITGDAQNTLLQPKSAIFKDLMAAEALYAKLDKANPGNVVLTAVQMEGKRGWKANFDKIGKGQLSIKDLSGLIDPTQSGEWNFATRIFTETGDALWEWMNHGLDVADKGETTLTHDVDLPDNYDFTIYVVLVKSPWKK